MEVIRGLKVSRKYQGPASTLSNLVDQKGDHFMAIQFSDEFHDHPILNDSLSVVLEFLQSPMIGGISPLHDYDPQSGTFVFATGVVWSVAEVIRILSDMGIQAGPRAGLEFLFDGGRILADISASAQSYAVYSHGGLTPWRILLKKSGQIEVIGYALPQVELFDYLQGGEIPREDSFRYCPPERLQRENEDLDSDIFALALIAFELMTSRPIYDGTVDMIHQKAIRGEVSRQIFQSGLPKSVQGILQRALHIDRDSRYERMEDFLLEIQHVLALPTIEGYTLREIMSHATTYQPRTRPMQEMTSSPTSIFDKEQLKEMIEEDISEDSEEASENISGLRIQSFDIDEATMSRPLRGNRNRSDISTEIPQKLQESLQKTRNISKANVSTNASGPLHQTPSSLENDKKVHFQRVNRSSSIPQENEIQPTALHTETSSSPETPSSSPNQLIAMLRQSTNSVGDLAQSVEISQKEEEQLSRGAKGVISALQGRANSTVQNTPVVSNSKKELRSEQPFENRSQKSGQVFLSRNIVRAQPEEPPSDSISLQSSFSEDLELESEEDWSQDAFDDADTAAFVRPPPKKKQVVGTIDVPSDVLKNRNQIQTSSKESELFDEIEKANKIIEEEGDISKTLERPKKTPQKTPQSTPQREQKQRAQEQRAQEQKEIIANKEKQPEQNKQRSINKDLEKAKSEDKSETNPEQNIRSMEQLQETQDVLRSDSVQEAKQPQLPQEVMEKQLDNDVEELIQPPVFDTGTTLREGFGKVYQPYLLKPIRSTGEKITVAIQLSTEENTLRFPLLSNSTLSELIGTILMGKYLPNPVNAMGQLMVYYQFMQNGVLLPSSLKLSQLSVPIHLVLCTQKAEMVPCYIEIEEQEPSKKIKILSVVQGVTLYVSTAITVHSLIDHCLHSFDLQSGNWELCALNKKLHRFMYVGEIKKSYKSKPLHLRLIRIP